MRRAAPLALPVRHVARAACALVLAWAWGVALAQEDEGAGEERFVAGLAEVRALMEARDWSDARARLLTLLDEHEGRDYVRIRRVEIREEIRRCAVRIAVPEPDPKSLISGRLVGYNRSSGQIHLVYHPEDLADFERQAPSGLLVHPLSFAGPYSVELIRDGMDRYGTILVGIHGDEAWQADFGIVGANAKGETHLLAARLLHLTGREHEVLGESDRKLPSGGKRTSLKVAVSSNDIAVSVDSRRLLSAKKPPEHWGQVGIGLALGIPAAADFEEIVIRGRANSSWLQGLADAATKEEERAFLATYDPDGDLPEWLRDGDPGAATGAGAGADAEPTSRNETLPWKVPEDQLPIAQEIARCLEAGDFKGAASKLVESGSKLPRDLQEYFAVQALIGAESWDRALPYARGLAERNPEFVTGRIMCGVVLAHLGYRPEAIAELREAVRLDAARADACRALAEMFLLEGRLDDARAAVLDARRAGAKSPRLDEIDRIIAKAARGPNWTRSFTKESRHYRIVSDIDAKTCDDAAKVLEETYGRCAQRFGEPAAGDGETRFRVFLFSGREGFEEYVRNLFERKPQGMAGLYSYGLKQLLIWNLPDRGDMMATVRHEGVHQYLDLLGTDPPTWFNEGLAEYLSLIRIHTRTRQAVEGEAHDPYVRALRSRRDRLLPLDRFLRLQGEVFYRDTEITYPEAWAVTHFLLHGGEAPRALFDRLLAAVLGGARPDETMAKALEGVDLAALDAQFRAHLDGLAP